MNYYTIFQTIKHRRVPKKHIQRTLYEVSGALGKPGYVSVHIIADKRMRRLNREYRGVDKTTDVLSFGLENESDQWDNFLPDWGDLFLCAPQIERQAKAWGVPYKQEFTRMLIHGMLHLLGYDHTKKRNASVMFSLQEKFLRRFL